MAQDNNLQRTAAGFAVLLATVTEIVRQGASLMRLDAYDDACEEILGALRAAGMDDEQVQSVHKALARLRLAVEERK